MVTAAHATPPLPVRFTSIAAAHINFLLATLSKKNFKSNVAELFQMMEVLGHDSYMLMLDTLIRSCARQPSRRWIPNSVSGETGVAPKQDVLQSQLQLLSQEFTSILENPNAQWTLTQLFENHEDGPKIDAELMCRLLGLKVVQELVLAQCFSVSTTPHIKQQGAALLKSKAGEFMKSAATAVAAASPGLLHNLVSLGRRSQEGDALQRLNDEVVEVVKGQLSPHDAPVELVAVLYPEQAHQSSQDQYPHTPTADCPVPVSDEQKPERLAHILQEFGYSVCHSSELLVSVIQQYGCATSDVVLGAILGMMASSKNDAVTESTHLKATISTLGTMWKPQVDVTQIPAKMTSWNYSVVFDVFRNGRAKDEAIDTAAVMRSAFEYPELAKSEECVRFLLKMFESLANRGSSSQTSTTSRGKKQPPPPAVPVEPFVAPWNNIPAQCAFLRILVECKDLAEKIFHDDCTGVVADADVLADTGEAKVWRHHKLVTRILDVSNVDVGMLQLFKNATEKCMATFVVALAASTPLFVDARDAIIQSLVAGYLEGTGADTQTCGRVLDLMARSNITLLSRCMLVWAQSNAARLRRVVELATKRPACLKALLATPGLADVLPFAVVAGREKELDLSEWVTGRVEKDPQSLSAVLEFAQRAAGVESAGEGSSGSNLQVEGLEIAVLVDMIAKRLPSSTSVALLQKRFCTPTKRASGAGDGHPPAADAAQAHRAPGPAGEDAAPPSDLPPIEQLSVQAHTAAQHQGHPRAHPMPVQAAVTGGGHAHVQRGAGEAAGADAGAAVAGTGDVDGEAHLILQRMYNRNMRIREVLDLLKRFKHSEERREREVFLRTIHTLFDEYRFLDGYPDTELNITGIFFGGLIQSDLVEYVYLSVATKYVLEALRQSTGSKHFKFGIYALEQFKGRLKEWPVYADYLTQIAHFRKFPPDMMAQIEEAAVQASALKKVVACPDPTDFTHMQQCMKQAGLAGDVMGAIMGLPPSGLGDKHGAGQATAQPTKKDTPPAPTTFTSLDIATLLENQLSLAYVPSDANMEKVAFILNNLSTNNRQFKRAELGSLMKADGAAWYEWFAQYLVIKRVSIEPNFHSLYTDLVVHSDAPLRQQVTREVVRNIVVLLNSPSIHTHQERTLLKNLASFLGGITLPFNGPIVQRDLDLRHLLLGGYSSGKLIIAVPVVCKILSHVNKSRVFRLPNPWTSMCLRLLVGAHKLPDVSQKVQFEIELLLKGLKINIDDIVPDTEAYKNTPTEGPGHPGIPLLPTLPHQHKPALDMAPPGPGSAPGTGTAPSAAVPGMRAGGIGAVAKINVSLALFVQHPGLCSLVQVAVERAVQEMQTIVDKATTISCISTREMILKDFALEADDAKMRQAAHLMVGALTRNLALVTTKDPLRLSLASNLRQVLLQGLANQATATPEVQVQEQVMQAVEVCTQENLEAACAMVEAAAVEKATKDVDDALTQHYSMRAQRKPFYEPQLTMRLSYLPEQLRPSLKTTPRQMHMYEDFAASNTTAPAPHSKPPPPAQAHAQAMGTGQQAAPSTGTHRQPTGERGGASAGEHGSAASLNAKEALEKLMTAMSEIDKMVTHYSHQSLASLLHAGNPPINAMFNQVRSVLLETNLDSRKETTLAFSYKVLGALLNRVHAQSGILYRDIYVQTIENMQEFFPKLSNEIVAWLTHRDMDLKWQIPFYEVVAAFIRRRLVPMAEMDQYFARLIIETRGDQKIVDLCRELVTDLLVKQPPSHLGPKDKALFAIRDAIATVAQHWQSLGNEDGAKEIAKVLELAGEAAAGPGDTHELPDDMPCPMRPPEPKGGARDQLTALFEEWMRVYYRGPENTLAQLDRFIQSLLKHPQVCVEDSLLALLCIATEQSCALCYMAAGAGAPHKPGEAVVINLRPVDGLARMLSLMVRNAPEALSGMDECAMVRLALVAVVGTMKHDIRARGSLYQQRVGMRLLSSFLLGVNDFIRNPAMEATIAETFAAVLHGLRPELFPVFSFAWVELVSHRMVMPKLLLSKECRGWPHFQRLVMDMLAFVARHVDQPALSGPTRLLYKGAMRILLVLLHDFPEFLCNYHFSMCDLIPVGCVQMRNLVLSAFPRNMRVPDPFTPNLKVDLLPEINRPPVIKSPYTQVLQANQFKDDIDKYLKTRAPVPFLMDLRSRLLLPQDDPRRAKCKYDVKVINALVLYVGVEAIVQLANKPTLSVSTMNHSAPMDIFQQLVVDLDAEGRYLFLNAIANHLRYPNSHTHYFSCVLLFLFAEATEEMIQEQITRVLLERLIVSRPHPWGLITFLELIRNPLYQFWKHSFVRCAPEIKMLFNSVAKSCKLEFGGAETAGGHASWRT